jgi:hypothetical protein
VADPVPPPAADLALRYRQLAHRHAVELRLASVLAAGGGISALMQSATEAAANPMWLIDQRHRVVARSADVRGAEFRHPDVAQLLGELGPVDLAVPSPVLVPARPARGLERRHLLVPVARSSHLFAWLVVAEVSSRIAEDTVWLASRTAFHLASEYAVQRRVARASWNARAALARQLVRGSHREDDVSAAADYLGVRVEADRVLVYLADDDVARDEEAVSELVAGAMGVEVLGARGREGTILLIEVPDSATRVSAVQEVKRVMRLVVAELGEPDAIVGVSGVTRTDLLQRSYRETREVVLCVDRFARGGDRVVAVDDLGPARLLIANGDVGAVRRYVNDVLGPLLGTVPGSADLIRTLQCFFDAGRSVREAATRLGIHENTVRLRMSKIHDLTGLDVAASSNDQLSAQAALLVLRLEGHPAIPPFDDAGESRATEKWSG